MELTGEERRLAIELAVATTKCGTSTGEMVLKPGYCFHGYQGPFDQCCRTLWSLDLAVGAFVEGQHYRELHYDEFEPSHFPPYFRFASEEEIRCRLAQDPRLDSVILKDLISNYLALECDYSGLNSSPRWFTPTPHIFHILDAFAACGYAEKDGDAYRWSAAMAPHMIEQGAWTEDGRYYKDVLTEELKAFISQLPDAERYELLSLARTEGSYLFVMKRFMDGLDKEDWLRHFPAYGNSPQSITRDFYRILEGKEP